MYEYRFVGCITANAFQTFMYITLTVFIYVYYVTKILSTPSFGGEVKPLVPCRRFAARKRSLNGVQVVISAKLPDNILAHSSTFECYDLSRRCRCGGTRRQKWERLKVGDSNGNLPLRNLPRMQRARAISHLTGLWFLPNWPKG